MIHGPCGATRFSSTCMKQGRCSKFFPKKYTLSTTFEEDGYPCYKHKDNDISIEKMGLN